MLPSNDSPTRRSFLGGTILGLAAAAAPPPALGQDHPKTTNTDPTSPPAFDFNQSSSALQADELVPSACQFCNSNCRILVHKKRGRVLRLTGEALDPVQAGELCLKADLMTEILVSERRLRRPMKRIAGEKGQAESRFTEISWDEAYEIWGKKLLQLRDEGEGRSIVNRTTGRMLRGAGSIIERILRLLGSPNHSDVGPVCNDAGGDALAATFGLGLFTNGYGVDANTGQEDLGAARLMLLVGTNQAETHPVTFSYLLRARAKSKARLVVVDPRRTPTGGMADRWLAIKPGTDLALALGMIGTIIEKGWVAKDFIERWTLGYAELEAFVQERKYNAAWAAGVCDIPAAELLQLAEDYAKTRPAAIFCNAGVSHQINAFQTYRAFAILAAITGQIGVPGAGCNFMHNTWPGALSLGPTEASFPNITDPAMPLGPDSLARAVLEERPYKVRALSVAGNPLLASSNTSRVSEALKRLEFYASTSLFADETSHYADLLLPIASGFEFDGVYMRRDDRGIRWQDQAAPRVGESKTDVEIWVGLAQALSRLDPKNSANWQKAIQPEWADYSKLWACFVKNTPGLAGLSRERLRSSPVPLRYPCPKPSSPGISTLYADHPAWYEAVEAIAPARKGQRFLTPSGKVEITTMPLEARLGAIGHSALPEFYTHPEIPGGLPSIAFEDTLVEDPLHSGSLTLRARIGERRSGAVSADYPLIGTIGRASVVHFAGVTQWTPSGKRLNGERFFQVHPKTASRAGIKDGEECTIESPRGQIRGTAQHWEGIREDTVFIPNSFGPAQAAGDALGFERYEAANQLTDERFFDNISGQQAYKAFACRLKKL